MTSDNHVWIGLDVGGANLKISHESGASAALRFAVWRNPEGLVEAIRLAASAVPSADAVALTMTAELCDCFETKREGVLRVLDSVEAAFPDFKITVWGVDQRFHNLASIRTNPLPAAASNWIALARCVSRRVERPTLLIDIGSTTTDVTLVDRDRVVSTSNTDCDRLQSEELVYVGVRRTPVCALGTQIPWRSGMMGLAAELFATTLDVYVVLGEIPEDPLDHESADGRPVTRENARMRLARMIGADGESFSEADALEFARICDVVIVERIASSCRRVLQRNKVERPECLVSGSGESLALRVAEVLVQDAGSNRRLSDVWNPAASEAACARALVELVNDDTLHLSIR